MAILAGPAKLIVALYEAVKSYTRHRCDDTSNAGVIIMRIIRLKEVMDSTGLARSTVYKYIEAGSFPKSVPLGGRSVGWVEHEVQEWIEDLIAKRDEETL